MVTTMCFLVTGGVKVLGVALLHFSHQDSEFHSISTFSTSHYKYDEWLEKVVIGVWALKWSPQRVFELWVVSKFAYLFSTVDTDVM
eukprot:scaffold190449_cov43-Cyclotella_meneghiniana.AAC.2